MKKIKYLNLEIDINDEFLFESKIHELTKGYDINLTVFLVNDISFDLSKKLVSFLTENKIECFDSDYNFDINEIVKNDYRNSIKKGEKFFEFKENELYTLNDYNKFLELQDHYIYTFEEYFYTNLGVLTSDTRAITFKNENRNKKVDEIIEYFSLVLSVLRGAIDNAVKINKIPTKNKTENFFVLDLSNNSITEKIIYLHKLGILDFLKSKQPFQSSTNRLATVLSAFTDAKAGTLQSMLNPIYSQGVNKKNSPLFSDKIVSKVNKQLISLGFSLNESI